jgi:hypothetical protein
MVLSFFDSKLFCKPCDAAFAAVKSFRNFELEGFEPVQPLLAFGDSRSDGTSGTSGTESVRQQLEPSEAIERFKRVHFELNPEHAQPLLREITLCHLKDASRMRLAL